MVWLLAVALAAPLIVSGQSNALDLAPRLARYQTVIGYQRGAQPIAYWNVGAEGWQRLAASIRGRADAIGFVWCQGEADAVDTTRTPGSYLRALTDLIERVRAITRKDLPVRFCELGPAPVNDAINAELRQLVRADPLAAIVPTRDLPFKPDQIHPTDVGYDLLARRIRRSLN